MPGANYGTDFQTMATAAQKVESTNEQVQGQLQQLKNKLDPLQSVWKGGAYASFQSLMERWNQDAKQLNDALRSIGERLKANQQKYQQSEDTNQSSFTSISNRLG